MKRSLLVWLVVAAVFMALAVVWMSPWEQEREVVHSLHLPQVSPTLAEKQELAYRWFHWQNVETVNIKEFRALNLVSYDYNLNVGNSSFKIAYLGLADDGKVYYAKESALWWLPYDILSHELRDDQLHLRLKRTDWGVGVYLAIAIFTGIIPAAVAYRPSSRDGNP